MTDTTTTAAVAAATSTISAVPPIVDLRSEPSPDATMTADQAVATVADLLDRKNHHHDWAATAPSVPPPDGVVVGGDVTQLPVENSVAPQDKVMADTATSVDRMAPAPPTTTNGHGPTAVNGDATTPDKVVTSTNDSATSNNLPTIEQTTTTAAASDSVSPPADTDTTTATTDDTTAAVAPPHPPPAVSEMDNSNNDAQSLRTQLETVQAELAAVRAEQARRMDDDGALLLELQGKLQQHMGSRAEAEDQARRTQAALEQLQQDSAAQQAELQKYQELQEQWHSQKTDQAEAEHTLREAHKQRDKLQDEKQALQEIIASLETQVESLEQARANQEEELKTIREQRDEQERREIALTNRLNAAKKKEADKANLAEHFEDEMKALREDADEAKKQVEELTQAKTSLEDELASVKSRSEAHIRRAELALADEKKLNEDRKLKMKAFIEKKSEELRQTKADSESMQTELTQTSKSLMDLNSRWKQLHAQWVQSQTRNRELQRELNRIKKDSENLHKVGDTLEMKLSRSATETEEHKNKRLAAKNELMTVLKTLEAERGVSSRLRDAIKFTFTPKALSQQQLLRDSIADLENELNRLSRRFGKPLPPLSTGLDASERGEFDNVVASEGLSPGEDGRASRADMDIQRLIAKLDNETQGVSQHIVALSGEIERLHMLIDVSGARSCYSALSEIILGGSDGSGATRDNQGGVAESTVPLRAIRSHQYGQVPSSAGT